MTQPQPEIYFNHANELAQGLTQKQSALHTYVQSFLYIVTMVAALRYLLKRLYTPTVSSLCRIAISTYKFVAHTNSIISRFRKRAC
jgi:flagellar biogenesis protein FliO